MIFPRYLKTFFNILIILIMSMSLYAGEKKECNFWTDAMYPEYTIVLYDILFVKVRDVPYLSGTFVINSEGAADISLIGKVYLKGKTLKTCVQELEGYFSKYLADPSVSVSIRKSDVNEVVVVGAVAKDAMVSYVEDMTVRDALFFVGGVLLKDYDGVIRVLREGEVYESDRILEMNLLPMDIVEVVKKERPSVYVIGEVGNPGVYVLPTQEPTDILHIINRAGGLTDFAHSGRVQIIRKNDKGKQTVMLCDVNNMIERQKTEKDKADVLKDGDIIYVPFLGSIQKIKWWYGIPVIVIIGLLII